MKKPLLALFVYLLCTLPVHSAIQKVLLVTAMEEEAIPIINSLHLKTSTHSFSNLPMKGYRGRVGKLDIMLIMNGRDPVNNVQNIGTEPATLSTYLGIHYFHPDLIISIGTAGGVRENGAALRDIYMSQKINFIDRRIPMPGYEAYGRGEYPSMVMELLDTKIKLKKGILCTGGSFDEEEVDRNIFLKENCAAIDMEAAGVAWVSMVTNTPMIALKGITNFVRGENIHEQFEKNLPIVMQDLSLGLKDILSQV